MSPTVSVVIPLYNKEKWIERTLSSVLNQSFTDWEVIIVDDGSTDRSVEVVEEFIQKNPGKWVLIKNHNAGQCRTRNAGIAKATVNTWPSLMPMIFGLEISYLTR